MIVFGLTGGIGSGKSTAARQLRARGVPLVDADELSRVVVEPGRPALAEIVAVFGAEALRADGTLDRARLAARVFANEREPNALRALNAIVHPAVRAEAHARFDGLARAGEPLTGYEVPLLYEVGLERELWPIIVVDAPLELRLARIRGARRAFRRGSARSRGLTNAPFRKGTPRRVRDRERGQRGGARAGRESHVRFAVR